MLLLVSIADADAPAVVADDSTVRGPTVEREREKYYIFSTVFSDFFSSWAVPQQTGTKSTGKNNPCKQIFRRVAWDGPLKCLSIEMHFFFI